MTKYINSFDQIFDVFDKLDKKLNKKINIYLIGGSVLLYNNLKVGTKDIDIVVLKKEDFDLFNNILIESEFTIEKPTKDYSNMKLDKILVKENYRIDVFNKIVCGKLSLSENIIKRSKLIRNYKNISLFVCSNEDVFVFKSITEREGDVDDCQSISLSGPSWDIMLTEIKNQIKENGSDVWITWFEERLNLLEDRGVVIPIIKDIRKMSLEYFANLEKSLKD
jgi:hypothetical protein